MKRIIYEHPVIKAVIFRSCRSIANQSINGQHDGFSNLDGSWDGNNSGEGFTEQEGQW